MKRKKIEKIGVLTSGGDCPGLNAVIRGVVRAAHEQGWETYGFSDGYEGLLSPVRYRKLDPNGVDRIMPMGGTILGTVNRGRFAAKVGAGKKAEIPKAILSEARETFEGLGLGALVCIGGDGSLSTALQLQKAGVPVVGVPKTIDNDLSATNMTFGFDSAVEVVVDALDRLHTTARSHKRIMVVEVMGRHAGWIALHGGLGGGADVILIPEIPYRKKILVDLLRQRRSDGFGSSMIVVAEGAKEHGKKRDRQGQLFEDFAGHAGQLNDNGRRVDSAPAPWHQSCSAAPPKKPSCVAKARCASAGSGNNWPR
ncbi:MAG: 6-phosphofructokinase, partial [Chthoniobacterales bacterium]